MKSAGLAAGRPAIGASAEQVHKPAYRASSFYPASAPRKITDNLFVFEDTCNVYVIRDGNGCVLIDFGSGKILDHLKDMGISKVDWILHTHHHRDQCQGDARAAAQSIPIAVPAHERQFFSDAENFWRNRRVFELYYMRNDFYTVTENIPVARLLPDYSTLRWNNLEIFVLPTPGHTLGSISLVATVDGQKVAFTGDLMYSPGKIQTLHDTQVDYGGFEGIDFGICSLARLRELKPTILCPSHGEPLREPDNGIAETMGRLSGYYHFQTGKAPTEENKPYAISPHLVGHNQTESAFYAIISNSGRAMFIDYGSASVVQCATFERATAVNDRIRFVEHSIDELRRNWGLKSIDVAMPSHMHDDHMNGFPHLIRHYGTNVWCYQNMVDIFENPRGRNLGCTLGEPFKVARSFQHGEAFRWEEFEFEITHSPGHTEYQMALFVTIDGNRVAFTGDAFFMPNPINDGTMRHNLIFRNHVENDSHLKSIHNLIEHEPNLICPGHGKSYPVNRALMLATEQKFRKQQQFFVDLLPEGEADFGLDPSWLKIYPYQVLAASGKQQELQILVQNYKPSPMKLEIALVAPSEWRIEPDVAKIEVPARSHGRHPVRITIPASWHPPCPRFAIAADVMCDGKYLGQIAEAVVDIV